MITKEKKSHNIGEALIKPCMLKAAGVLLETTYRKKIMKISLSNSTIKTCIHEHAKTLSVKFSKNYKSGFFLIQGDETTDIAQLSKLLVYVCFN